MSQIKINRLTFAHYGAAENLFENVSLNLDTDWRLGFIGRNGRGKTTFLKLLRGEYEYQGLISASVDFEFFPFPVPDQDRTAALIVGDILGDQEQWRLERELSLLKVDPAVLDRPFRTLSGGERTKLLLAALFLKDNNFLLIDEPTNHLDMRGRALVGDYLRGKSGYILVSHDRAFLDQCVDHVLSLNRADIELQKGNFSSWQRNRELSDQHELARERQLKADIRKLGEAARRGSGWSDRLENTKKGHGPVDRGFIGRRSAKMMQRAKAVEDRRLKAIGEKKELLKNLETSDQLAIATVRHHAGRLVTMRDLSVKYGPKPVLENFNLTLDHGERLVLTGPNGCGKSSLLKLVAGDGSVPHTGEMRLAPNLIISYVPQDISFLKGSLRDHIRRNNLDESRFKAILHKLGFEKTQFDGDLSDWSCGQKKKVLIAAGLCGPAHLHVWDEPLNFMDIISRIQLENLIVEHQPTLLLVEHDRRFAEKVATSLIEL